MAAGSDSRIRPRSPNRQEISDNRYHGPQESLIPIEIHQPRYGGAFATSGPELLSFVLPGEIVDDTASQPVILAPSPSRVEPRCVHFGECGGCQYQHAGYPAQLALKREILGDVFALAGLTALPEIVVHHGPEWEYRNRIRLRVDTSAAGVRLGYSRRASNDFLPIRMCPIAAPLLWRAAAVLMELAAPGSALRRFLNAVSEVEFFTSADQSRLQILFLIRSPELARAESFPTLCEQLRQQLPQLTGAGATLDPELNRSSRRKARWDDLAWGAAGLSYEAAGRPYWVSRGAFFQVNRYLVDELVALVTDDQTGELAWDLFAGVGLFTRALAERFTLVVAVEAGQAAAADLAIAAKGGKDRPPFEAVRATTLDFLSARELQRERPELIVLDPPRAGLGPEASEILTRISAPQVVYVSCDPVTLARDLAILTRVYRIDAIHLIDLFPQTFHMETVVHLSKQS